MDVDVVLRYVVSPLAVIAVTAVLRWGIKVDRGLLRTLTALESVEKRLNGHGRRLSHLEASKPLTRRRKPVR